MKISLEMVLDVLGLNETVVQKPSYPCKGIEAFEPRGGEMVAVVLEDAAPGDAPVFSAEGFGAAELASRAKSALARLQAWAGRLALSIARGDGLPGFWTVAAEALANPVALFSMDGTVLATAGSFEGPIAGTVWERLGSGVVD